MISLIELIFIDSSVSVYAPKKGRKEVDDNDLWYGIIECICVDKRPKALQVCFLKKYALILCVSVLSFFAAFLGQNMLVLVQRSSRAVF